MTRCIYGAMIAMCLWTHAGAILNNEKIEESETVKRGNISQNAKRRKH
jgi:hypothetical protein